MNREKNKYGSFWSDDEYILSLDLYFRTKPNERDAGNDKLRDVARITGRTPCSIVKRLGNYSAIDPDSKLIGFSHGSKKVRDFFEEYQNCKGELKKRANAIREKLIGIQGSAKSKQLKKLISDVNKSSDYLKQKTKECNDVHKSFLKRWPIEKLPNLLTLNSYVIGRNDHDTFCYWIEVKTRILGSILGANASKFKVYCGKADQTYKWVKGFDNAQEAFKATKNEIINILDAARREDFNAIKRNKFFKDSHLFRGKILFLYFPDKFLNIFAPDDIDYFLDKLGIYYVPREHLMDKQEKLIQFKKSIPYIRDWDNIQFMQFLYYVFRPPSKSHVSKRTEPIRTEEGVLILPDVESVQINEIDFSELDSNMIPDGATGKKRKKQKSHKKPNYVAECIRNTKLGDHAEKVVLEYERVRLKQEKKPDLAKKVCQVSSKDDYLGYDILSFTSDGSEKYIEVKATRAGVDDNTPFYLTDNEKKTMNSNPDKYQIYRVFAANRIRPKLLIIDCKQFESMCKMKTQLWQVSFK